MSDTKYNIGMLNEISQIDMPLALKKSNDTNVVFGYAADFVRNASPFLEKYDGDGIYDNHTEFLTDTGALRTCAEKLYATTFIWDIDDLVKAFKSGNRKAISEKYDNLKISGEVLINRINRCECDEKGNLLKPLSEEGTEGDAELMAQPECGKTVRGNFASIDSFKRIALLVDSLNFDEAERLLKKASSIYYNERVNIEMKKLIWTMKMGEFEKASESVRILIEAAKKHNEAVHADSEVIKPRVLVVDDAPDMLLTVKGILYEMCHVCTVTNHISAIRFLENCHADLILLDIGLNEVDGFELLRRIRLIQKYEKTPIMFLTGNVSKEDILRAIDVGISDYLRKPIDAAMLISRVKMRLEEQLKLPQHTA